MKRLKTILFAGLILLLTACHETYDHISDAHDGMSGGTIGLYVFIMIFCFAFLAGGIPLLVFGIRTLKRKPSYKGGPITRVTFGGIFIFIGVLAMILTTTSFFNPEFAIPESRNYKTVAKVLEKATDERATHFRCSRRGYNRNEYLRDEGYVIRDSLKDLTFKSIKQKDKELSHGAHLEYYVDLEPQNGATYPFSEIRIYEDGYCYVDYVKAYQHKTATFFYEIESNTAKTIVSLAEQKNDEQRNRAYQQEMELRERGKIENFFDNTKDLSQTMATLAIGSKDVRSFSFLKEGYDIISDFRYEEISNRESHLKKSLLILYSGNWAFRLCEDTESGYFIKLIYSPSGRSFEYYYSIRNFDAEAMLGVAKEEFINQFPQEFDFEAMAEKGKIEFFFDANFPQDFELSSISCDEHNYQMTIKRNIPMNLKGYTYTLVEKTDITEQPVIVNMEGNSLAWNYKLHGDMANEKDYYIELNYEFKDSFEDKHTATFYYTVSDEDGKSIYNVILDEFKKIRPDLFYAEYEDGKIENFFTEVVKEDNDHCSVYYRSAYHLLTISKEDLVIVSQYNYTLVPNIYTSKGTVLRIYNFTPFWEFCLQKCNVNDQMYFVSLKYTFRDATNTLTDIYYTYSISNIDASALLSLFVTRCVEQYPELAR